MSFAYAYRGVTTKMHIFMVPQSPTNNSPRVQTYTRSLNTWAAGTSGSLTIERGLAAAAVGGWVYTFAGAYDSGGGTFAVQTSPRTYKVDAAVWATGDTAHPAPRDGAVCQTLGASVLMCGGTAGTFTSTSDRGSTTVYESYLGAHVSRTAFTGKRTECGWGQHVTTGDIAAEKAMICGGFERTTGVSDYLDSTYEYTHISDSWASKQAMNSERYAGGCFTIDNEQYVIGGAVGALDNNVSTVESWLSTRNTWVTRTSISGTTRRSIGCGVLSGKGYACGGSADGAGTTNYALNYEYDPFRDTWEAKQNYTAPANIVMRGASA